MQQTTNYNLLKPEDNEIFDQQAHANVNMDQIDAALTPTADPTQAPNDSGPGKLIQWVSWLTNRIKAITGKANWWDAPDTTLAAAKAHMDGVDPHPQYAFDTDLASHKNLVTLDHPDNSVTDAKIGNRTIVDGTAPTGDSGTVTTLLGWLANMIKSITGKANWRTAPAKTIQQLSDDQAAHLADFAGHGATSAATADRVILRDAAGRAKVAAPSAYDDIARKSEVDNAIVAVRVTKGTALIQDSVSANSTLTKTISIPSGKVAGMLAIGVGYNYAGAIVLFTTVALEAFGLVSVPYNFNAAGGGRPRAAYENLTYDPYFGVVSDVNYLVLQDAYISGTNLTLVFKNNNETVSHYLSCYLTWEVW